MAPGARMCLCDPENQIMPPGPHDGGWVRGSGGAADQDGHQPVPAVRGGEAGAGGVWWVGGHWRLEEEDPRLALQ